MGSSVLEGRPFRPRFFGLQDSSAARHPVFALCRRTSPFEPREAMKVIGKVGHADLDPGPGDAKLHAVCDRRGRPLIMLLGEGQMSDYRALR